MLLSDNGLVYLYIVSRLKHVFVKMTIEVLLASAFSILLIIAFIEHNLHASTAKCLVSVTHTIFSITMANEMPYPLVCVFVRHGHVCGEQMNTYFNIL